MSVAVSYPGVYIQEIPSGVRTITGVATSIAAFVDFFAAGVMNKATPLRPRRPVHAPRARKGATTKFIAPAYYKFESIFLHRRVCEFLVPNRRSPICCLAEPLEPPAKANATLLEGEVADAWLIWWRA